jgi:hypothetical protein
MMPITGIASKFFDACETGKGWAVCQEYCHAGATFSAQAEPLADVRRIATVHGLDEGPAHVHA